MFKENLRGMIRMAEWLFEKEKQSTNRFNVGMYFSGVLSALKQLFE